ncbi:hypothetical protein M8C21_001132 [Ambrosia artemisiifolia]|uniref:Uncharacterized protein n=1 Tax=Ambrosia artemisiifolia TaxID=4212 RepID=A0AAD5CIJ1_AMBAR|nr:hypothetical protein M8C21_001132 [Ambrosia artemisiifolia]
MLQWNLTKGCITGQPLPRLLVFGLKVMTILFYTKEVLLYTVGLNIPNIVSHTIVVTIHYLIRYSFPMVSLAGILIYHVTEY